MKNIGELYNLINETITSELTSSIWEGFSPCKFYLYDGTICYGLKDGEIKEFKNDTNFMGNTAIEYKNDIVAIWDIRTWKEHAQNEEKIACIAHEMFHAHQHNNNWNNLLNEFKGFTYPHSSESLYFWTEEAEALYKATTTLNFKKSMEAFKKVIVYRELRKNYLKDYIDYDNNIESFEGTATYAEFKIKTILKHNNMEEQLEKLKYLMNPTEAMKSFRRACYFTGSLLCIILDKIENEKINREFSWKKDWVHSRKTLYEYTQSLFLKFVDEKSNNNEVKIDENKLARINKIIEEDLGLKKKAIDNFHVEKEGMKKCIIKNNIKLLGADPMNIICLNDKCLHTRFISVTIHNEDKILKGPVLAIIGENIFDIKEIQFWKKEN